MFSGIITHLGRVHNIYRKNRNSILEIKSNIKFSKKDIGSSISCSGACLTLINCNNKISKFFLSLETLNRTNFKHCKKGDFINLEKSLKFGERLSGHFVQGHVDTTCKVNKIIFVGTSWIIDIALPKKYNNYIVSKGSIAVNGVSLTIAKVFKNSFQVYIIPHTLKLTNLTKIKLNDVVNIEFDILVKYIKRI